MIARFFDYFGFVGTLSILVWLAAVAVAGHYIVRKRHRYLPRIALGLALAGLLLAQQRSEVISEMQVDRSAELRAQQDKVKAETVEAMKRRAADIHFAEDSSTDALDMAGATTGELKKLGSAGAAASQPSAEEAYAYRKQGKQERVTGKERAREFADPTDPASTQPAGTQPNNTFGDRVWPEAQVVEANWLDGWNMFLARLVFRALLILAVFDYLRRFSATFDVLLPWPLIHLVTDRVFRKAPAVFVRSPADSTLPRAFLERALHKGETFIYLGAADLWPGEPTLARGLLPQTFGQIDKLVFEAAPEKSIAGNAEASPATPPATLPDPAFVYNAVWFARACVVVVQPASVEAMLAHIVARLVNYPRQHAPADQTVNLVWNAGPLPSADVIRRVASLAGERNFRLMVFSPDALPSNLAGVFREVYDNPAKVPFSVPRAEKYMPKVDRGVGVVCGALCRAGAAVMVVVDRVMHAIAAPIERREMELAAAEAKAASAKKA
ncbi:MAG: hypothetical protein NTW19_19125 [Planctomycetota bacterium]|nr:hypothetical protein [Planctomycetota bacterium]